MNHLYIYMLLIIFYIKFFMITCDNVNNDNINQEKMALIIPYRNRKKDLSIFIPYITGFLRYQEIDNFDIFVIEQKNDGKNLIEENC